MATSKYKIDLSTRYSALLNGLASSKFPNVPNITPDAIAATALGKIPGLKYRGVTVKSNDPKKTKRSTITGNYLFDVITLRDKSTGNEYAFPNDPLIDFDFSKNLLITPIVGGEDVVELIGTNAVQMRLYGMLYDGSGIYPETQVREIKAAFDLDKVYEVNSRLFNLLNIKSIVIEDFQLIHMEGYEDTQPFRMAIRSHKPVELIILENQ
jgi:hypothetical protein